MPKNAKLYYNELLYDELLQDEIFLMNYSNDYPIILLLHLPDKQNFIQDGKFRLRRSFWCCGAFVTLSCHLRDETSEKSQHLLWEQWSLSKIKEIGYFQKIQVPPGCYIGYRGIFRHSVDSHEVLIKIGNSTRSNQTNSRKLIH